MIDHDRLFKELLTVFFSDFVALFLPEVASYLDDTSLEFLDKELFTDVTAGERHEADLVVKGTFRGQAACFLIHVEHQAQPQAEFGQRMFRYFARLYEKFGFPVYPVVVFSYAQPVREEPNHFQLDFPDKRILDFHFTVIQLNCLNWRDFTRQPNPVASALMSRMQIAPEDRPKVKLECLRLLASLKLDPARMQLISGFVDTYLRLNAQELQLFRQALKQADLEQKEEVMEIMTSWKEEGLQEGLQQGLQQEAVYFVLKLLTRQLGSIPEGQQAHIRTLTREQAEQLGDDLYDFKTVQDLNDWLDRTLAEGGEPK